MRDLKNSFVLLAGVFWISSCEAQNNKDTKNYNQVDSLCSINDSVFISKLKYLKLVLTQEKKVGALEYIIKDIPTKENPYYIIQAGKTNNYRLEIFYNFYCYPNSGDIKLYDVLYDTLVTPH
jgi:hypothetical protein